MGIALFASFMTAVTFKGIYEGERQALEAEEMSEKGAIPYASVFMECAEEVGWDWRLLAALAWTESHYNPQARSAHGARGVMQLIPKTGKRFGLNDSTILIAEHNIRAGARYIHYLDEHYAVVRDSAERWKFVVAAYNCGPASITAARDSARALGRNPNKWASVEPLIPQAETRGHVRKVEAVYRRIRKSEN